MSRPIIEIRGVSKRYRLGSIGLTSLRNEVERFWRRIRSPQWAMPEPAAEEFWALRNVSFDVQPGEVIGIVGRNGAGKSTLLKILSEITEPTAGEIVLRGRAASLLEVGTGFHPELSGRENIFMNGAILGMRRAEIARKFDEIVAFAEVGSFLDTPVKRYSSGMYVRLAFAVAAHLEPEILIVDEVLAVGDQAFQQKCLGKMNDVAHREGRTVLFVSHNMAAVNRLCDRAVRLAGGKVQAVGPAGAVVADYLAQGSDVRGTWERPADLPLRRKVSFLRAAVRGAGGEAAAVLPFPSAVTIELECEEQATTVPWGVRVSIYDAQGHELLTSDDTERNAPRPARPGGRATIRSIFPGGVLRPGVYSVGTAAYELFGDQPSTLYEEHEPLLTFEVSPQGYDGRGGRGLVGVAAEWKFDDV